jgi:undecaprenyl-diphosphatase
MNRNGHSTNPSTSPGGLEWWIADRMRAHHPVTVAVVVALVDFVVLGAVIVGLGLLVTHVLVNGGVGRWDEGVNDWFVTQRTTTLNAITAIGTTIGSTVTAIAVATIAVVVLAFRRLWREVGLVVVALSVEASVFLMTTLIVDRPRPTVPRLDPSPPTSSFPSGHVAAAIALWVSLAIVISMHVKSTFARTIVWIIALGVPTFVGLSRLYRGMHHPTDVMASILLGAGAVLVALLAVGAGSAVSARRRPPETLDAAADSPTVPLAS